MPQGCDVFKNVDTVLSLLRCADDALMSGDDCANDVLATHSVVSKLLKEVRRDLARSQKK